MQEHVAEVAKHIRIRKSTIKCAGGGAFIDVDVPAGRCIGFYEGRRVSAAESEKTRRHTCAITSSRTLGVALMPTIGCRSRGSSQFDAMSNL